MTAIRILTLAILSWTFSTVSGQTPSELPDLDLWTHGAVFQAEEESSGHLLIGGLFSLAGGLPRNNIARVLLPQEVIDPNFAPDVNGPVFVLLQQPDGSILIGGQFSRVNGLQRTNIARLNADGTLDTGFNPGANAPVYVLELDGLDHIIVGGSFSQFGGQARRGLARVALTDGTVDETWNPDVGGGGVFTLDRGLTDIWIGGNFDEVGGQTSRSLARLSQTGSLVTAYDVNGNVENISFDNAHGLYFCGRFTEINGQARSRIARLDLTGSLDSFSVLAAHDVHDCKAGNDSVLLGGQFVSINGEPAAGVARLTSAGDLDPDFRPAVGGVFTGTPGTDVLVWTVKELDDGRSFIGGVFRKVDDEPRVGAALVSSQSAQLLNPVHVELPAEVRTLQQFEDGSLILGGVFWRSADQSRDNLLRVKPDGGLDPDWTLPINGEVLSATVVSDGSLIVGGFFSAANGHPRENLARIILAEDPEVDPDWMPSANNAVLVLQADELDDDRVYAAGAFDAIGANGTHPRSAMTRLSLTTGMPDDFDPGFDGQINDLLQIPASNRIYAAGVFTMASGQLRRGLARFIDAGGKIQLDADFDAEANGNLWVLHAAEDGDSFYAGGEFTVLFGQTRVRFAKIGDGFEDWTPSTTGTPVAMALDGVGGLFVGGTFNSLNGVTRNLIGRLDASDASLDPDFNPGAAPGLVWQLETGPGRLYAAGSFEQAGEAQRNGFAAFEVETPAPPLPDSIFSDRFQLTVPVDGSRATRETEIVDSTYFVGWSKKCQQQATLHGRERAAGFLRAPQCE